jgi:chitin disaccharide deacetylase
VQHRRVKRQSDQLMEILHQNGRLIVNADDWGRDPQTTDRILECVVHKALSSASAMVFMEDSERAAAMARERGIDCGLHLNFTAPFSAPGTPLALLKRQHRLSVFLRRHRYAQVVFHPSLAGSFKYVVAAQLEEFERLYGTGPSRIDGHHHMHLCSNVLLGGLLPSGTVVRRSFSFQQREKGWSNRFYRKFVDRLLSRRHRLTDYFFSLQPFEPPGRLQRIFSLAREAVVEVVTHPVKPEELRFLAGGEIFGMLGNCLIEPGYFVAGHGC